MKEKLKDLRREKFIGTAQLAGEAARLIGQFVPRQERGSVSEVPDERMVRYYSAEGLISPPEGKQGLSAVYGYNHLLQLLAIKRLQADHLPIRKIKELVEGKSERELEQFLDPESDRAPAAARAKPKNTAIEYLESLLKHTAPRVAPPPAPPAASASQSLSLTSAWARVEVEPGLELHIREDYRLPVDARERQRLVRRILTEIESHGQKPGK
jgi:DNA-binding transcriptional MerR regulator